VKLLDLCTGSGCIPLLLCHLWPPGSVRAFGIDLSEEAVQLATENAAQCGIPSGIPPRCQNTNTFNPSLGNILDPVLINSLDPPYDILTSNPPYIPRREYEQLPPSVKNFEDPRALLGDLPGTNTQDGLTFYYSIARIASLSGFLTRG
jgi:release factor glutamine methyltransferase